MTKDRPGRGLRKEVLSSTFVMSAESDWIAGKFNISEDYNIEKSIFERMGGSYHKQGDYLLPDLAVPEEDKQPIGIWGQRHLRYIREHHRNLYVGLQLSGKLSGYLADVDQQAEDMFFQLVNQMAKQEGVTEKLKATNQMEWIRQMNNIQNRAAEIVNDKLIFA